MPKINAAVVGVALGGVAGATYLNKKLNQEPNRGPWDPRTDSQTHYDYIILGGGTAGCVLANRLTEDPKVNVLVLEAGYSDNITGSMTPGLFSTLWGTDVDWKFRTVPQKHAFGRIIRQPRGKLLGGSSSINAMMYHRGPSSDYDEWELLGNTGWSYKECLQYFKKAETLIDPNLPVGHPKGVSTNRIRHPQYEEFEPEYHGTEGPWQVSYHHLFRSTEKFIHASMAEGVPFNRDLNGTTALGVNRVQTFIQRDAVRSSAARAYLGPESLLKNGKPQTDRGKIRIVYGAHIVRVLIQERRGVKTAIGAEFLDDKHTMHSVMATKEVLLCAGAFGSPHILLASGIAPEPHSSIPHIHTLPGVGKGLADHLGINIVFRISPDCSTAIQKTQLHLIPKALYDYKINGVGVLSSQMAEGACFLRLEDIAPEFVAREKANGTWQDLSSGPQAPHIEIIFIASYSREHGSIKRPDSQNYYTLSGILLNPVSKGKVSISDVKDRKIETLIDPNYLEDEFDLRVIAEMVRFMRRLGARISQDPECGGGECYPGTEKVPSDNQAILEEFIRKDCNIYYHPTSTCHMGPPSDPLAVVDAHLNVYGIDRLRIVDASIMPKIPAAHTCAPVVMIAEKAADMIKEDWKNLFAKEQPNPSTIIATATAGLALAGIASWYSRQSKETGRESWNDKKDTYEYDYIIVGGGTAGCVLASRLAEDPNVSVLVIEAGEDMDNSYAVRIPIGLASLYRSKHDWQLKTVPQVHANGRMVEQVRGRMLGGCSSINSSQYTRGASSHFDQWATTFGNPGWSYQEVLPYFKKSERFHDPSLDPSHVRGPKTPRVYHPECDTFEEELHGTEGPWSVSFHHLYPIAKDFIQACVDEGIPRLLDPSSSPNIGVFRFHTSFQIDAVRSSTSTAFLGPKNVPGGGDRGRVRIVVKSAVDRILVEDQNGVKRATGVEFRDGRNVLRKICARREVLLCAGVFHSPMVLLKSGIGYKIHDYIPLVHPLKGVGESLVDPFCVPIVFTTPAHVKTIHRKLDVMNLLRETYNYFRHGTGILSSAHIESGCFLRLEDISPEFVSREKANGTWQECASGPDAPHIEIMFAPGFINKAGDPLAFPSGNYYTLMVVVLNPASKGRTGAMATEVSARGNGEKCLRLEPLVDPNYFADDFDMRVMKEAMKFARRLGRRMQLNPELAGVEYYPGEKAVPDDDSLAMEEFIRRETISSFHAVGTCPMGPSSNPEAVVDARLRVHGVDAVRVVDASIFPRALAGHTAASTVMVAEKSSDMIKEDWAIKQKTMTCI
ncbi:hypothetical protein BGX27_009834 [Mortierella sp. AM989]|nr:hypothetical protein BGX27_009834 [Mortierella sp. AM989]